MAHISIRRAKGGGYQLMINGVDYSMETYVGGELVEVGEPPFSEVGYRVTFVVSRLDLETDVDVQITDNFPTVATRVHSIMAEGGAE